MAMSSTDVIERASGLELPSGLVIPDSEVLAELFDTIRGASSTAICGFALSEGERDLLDGYHAEARKYPLLTRQQEVSLGRARVLGDHAIDRLDAETKPKDKRILRGLVDLRQEAVGTFVVTNLFLVSSIAERQKPRGFSKLDLIQEGNIGLMTAANKFDPEKGYKFSTYATWWIRQGIQTGVNSRGDMIRIVEREQRAIKALTVEEEILIKQLNRNPTIEELAESLGKPEDDIREIFSNRSLRDGGVSMNLLVGDDIEVEHQHEDKSIDVESIDRRAELGVDNATLVTDITEALITSERWAKVYIERNIRIFLAHAGLTGDSDLSQTDVARNHGLVRERVRQILDQAYDVLASDPKFSAKYAEYNVE